MVSPPAVRFCRKFRLGGGVGQRPGGGGNRQPGRVAQNAKELRFRRLCMNNGQRGGKRNKYRQSIQIGKSHSRGCETSLSYHNDVLCYSYGTMLRIPVTRHVCS